MKSLIIYDSFFGNTQKVAEIISEQLKKQGSSTLIRITEFTADMLKDIDLIVVGSPTRAFRATPAMTEAIKKLEKNALEGKKAAAFDTRIAVEKVDNKFLTIMVKLFGYAAKPLGKQLKSKGAQLISTEGFHVEGNEGPLSDGEVERISKWANSLK